MLFPVDKLLFSAGISNTGPTKEPVFGGRVVSKYVVSVMCCHCFVCIFDEILTMHITNSCNLSFLSFLYVGGSYIAWYMLI